MATYEPQTVYRRKLSIDGDDLPQFSTKPTVNVERELKKIESLKKFKAAYAQAVEEIQEHAASQATAETIADLKDLSEFLDFYAPIVSQAKEAQKELTMKLLLDNKDLEDIKEALGKSTSWLTIQSWAGKFTGIGKQRTFVEWLVPESLGKKLNAKVEENRSSANS